MSMFLFCGFQQVGKCPLYLYTLWKYPTVDISVLHFNNLLHLSEPAPSYLGTAPAPLRCKVSFISFYLSLIDRRQSGTYYTRSQTDMFDISYKNPDIHISPNIITALDMVDMLPQAYMLLRYQHGCVDSFLSNFLNCPIIKTIKLKDTRILVLTLGRYQNFRSLTHPIF